MLNNTRAGDPDRISLRHRSTLTFLLFIIALVVVGLVDELYLVSIQPATADLFPQWLHNWDLTGFILLNEQLASPSLDLVMLLVTHAGSTILWIFISALLWVAKKKREAVLLAFGIIIGGLVIFPVKILLPRARPYMIVDGARILDIEGGGSFPSGHSKNGFTAAAVLGSRWKRLKFPLYVLALLIGLSRVYVGLHWPFDVLVGSLIGWVMGKVTVRYAPKITTVMNNIMKTRIPAPDLAHDESY